VEEEILSDKVQPQTRAQIFTLKKNLLKFRRGAAPLREVLDLLTRGDVDLITDKLLPYYRDVYDHVLRATDFADNLRDILTSALDVHLSAVGNRLNEVMKVLTFITTFAVPFTVMGGLYGMNVKLPGVNGDGNPHIFWWILGGTTLFVVLMLIVLRRMERV
jgi:magnesium transporter